MSFSLQNRRILLIISGGIAAYKSLDLIRRLHEQGAAVRCVLTKGGSEFVTPLSVEALSEEKVFTDLFSLTDENQLRNRSRDNSDFVGNGAEQSRQQMGHIRLNREADLVLVAPASANLIARMAQGLADDLASTLLLATDKPVMIAPAMNVEMWHHAATQANIATLAARGIMQIGPSAGLMACNETGEGRMAEVGDIVAAVTQHFAKPGPLSGRRAIVTSGPTFEPIDPVRYIGNRSSGKQGHAIAEALRDQGADTILISGPTQLVDPQGLATIRVQTAEEMLAACEHALPADIAICAAAVADWRVADASDQKLKKSDTPRTLQLIENPDILARLSRISNVRPRLVIGFAAETQDVENLAAEKFARKGCDWLLANEVGHGKAFNQDNNSITFLRRDAAGHIVTDAWGLQSKSNIARQLVQEIVKHFAA